MRIIPSAGHLARQYALSRPGMGQLLAERRQAKAAHIDAVMAMPGRYTYSKAADRRRRNTAVCNLVVQDIEADITRKGGACLLEHEKRESMVRAMAVTAAFTVWLGVVSAIKQPMVIFTLPAVAAVVPVLVKTERFR